MTGILKTTEKNLMVFSGRAHPQLAEEVAEIRDRIEMKVRNLVAQLDRENL